MESRAEDEELLTAAARALAALGLDVHVDPHGGPLHLVVDGRTFRPLPLSAERETWKTVVGVLDAVVAADCGPPFVLLAERLSPSELTLLRQLGANAVDAQGNVTVSHDGLRLEVRGRGAARPRTPAAPAMIRRKRRSGLSVGFVILMDPELAVAPVRAVAAAADVSVSTAHAVLEGFRDDGLITSRGISDLSRLAGGWVEDYRRGYGPSSILGRFSAQPGWWRDITPHAAQDYGLIWGGETAAEILGGYLSTVRGVAYSFELPQRLLVDFRMSRYVPQRAGNGDVAEFRRPLWSPQWDQPPRWNGVVPRLLVYADLLATRDGRLHEVAADLREKSDDLRRLLG
ncbi:MAG: type IV toxin-antitoxin system AbiEi family antitoxin [Kineosporiaceae bacterium]